MKLHTLFINHSILCRYQTCWYTSQGYLHFPQTHITQNSPHPDAAKGWLYIYLHIYICSCLFVLHCAAAAWKAWPPQHLHLGSKPHSSSQRNRNWLTQHLQTLPIRSCSVHTGCGASQAPKADLIEVKKNGGYYSCLLVLGFTFLFLLVCKQCFQSIKIMGWWVCGWLSHLCKAVKGKKVIGQVCVVRNWFIIFWGVSFIPLLDSYKERLTENVMKESREWYAANPKKKKLNLREPVFTRGCGSETIDLIDLVEVSVTKRLLPDKVGSVRSSVSAAGSMLERESQDTAASAASISAFLLYNLWLVTSLFTLPIHSLMPLSHASLAFVHLSIYMSIYKLLCSASFFFQCYVLGPLIPEEIFAKIKSAFHQ